MRFIAYRVICSCCDCAEHLQIFMNSFDDPPSGTVADALDARTRGCILVAYHRMESFKESLYFKFVRLLLGDVSQPFCNFSKNTFVVSGIELKNQDP